MKPRTIRFALSLALLAAAFSAQAGLSEVTPIGKGRYMIGGRANTVFGSPGKLQAKAMKAANAYCANAHAGTEAVLQSAEGQRGHVGGWVEGGRFAETEIIFTCEASASPLPSPSSSD